MKYKYEVLVHNLSISTLLHIYLTAFVTLQMKGFTKHEFKKYILLQMTPTVVTGAAETGSKPSIFSSPSQSFFLSHHFLLAASLMQYI